jgi:hypothetical protein
MWNNGDEGYQNPALLSSVAYFSLRGGTYQLDFQGTHNGLLTMGTNPSDAQVVVLETITYRFKTTMAQANDVQIGVDANTSLASLIATLNGTGVAGTDYYTGTVSPAAAVSAGVIDTTNHTVIISARNLLTAGITSTKTVTNATFTATTLTSGPAVFYLQRLAPDGVTWIDRLAANISALTAFPTALALPPGSYRVISYFGVCAVSFTRVPTAVE